jgi:hypothetical protein
LLITFSHYHKVQNWSCSPSSALELGAQPTKAVRPKALAYEIEIGTLIARRNAR